jgi:hypothetical protein
MPASRGALAAAGRAAETSGFTNSTAVAHAHLAFLGDVFAVPTPLPLANVFSVGDVLLLVGAALLLHTASRRTDGLCRGCDGMHLPSWEVIDRLAGEISRGAAMVGCICRCCAWGQEAIDAHLDREASATAA